MEALDHLQFNMLSMVVEIASFLIFLVLGAAIVASTCSTAKVDYVRSLGADIVIDYTTTKFEDIVEDYDVVFDTLGQLFF